MNVQDARTALKEPVWAKALFMFVFAFGVPFYMAFVVEKLWNWFLAAAFRGPDVSYWQALGLMIIIYLLKDNTVDEKANWIRLFVIVEACVPDEHLHSVWETVEESGTRPWYVLVEPQVEKAVHSTCFLGVGWAIHTFLM